MGDDTCAADTVGNECVRVGGREVMYCDTRKKYYSIWCQLLKLLKYSITAFFSLYF